MGTKISALPAAGTLTGTEIVVMDQAGNTVTAPSGSMGIVARTTAESAAGVTPTNYAYQPGDLRRYGGDPTNTSDSSTALLNAILVSAQTNGQCAAYVAGGCWYKILTGAAYTGTNAITLRGDGASSRLYCDSTVLNCSGGASGSIVDNLGLYNITAPWIITRNPSNWAANISGTLQQSSTVLGYQPTVNDTDIWSSLTAAQQDQYVGPTVTFSGEATGILVSRIYGVFVVINIQDATNSTVRDCEFRGGKTGFGGITFDNWSNSVQRGSYNRAINNRVMYASFCGVCFLANDDPVAQNNECSLCGESGIKTYQANGVTFASSVGGSASGTISGPSSGLTSGTWTFVFSDGETRSVLVSSNVDCGWSPALNAGSILSASAYQTTLNPQCFRANFSGNICTENYYEGIDALATFDIQVDAAQTFHMVSGNYCYNNGDDGLGCDGQYNMYVGNMIVGNYRYGMHSYASFSAIRGNSFNNNNTSNTASVYDAVIGTQGDSVTGNIVRFTATAGGAVFGSQSSGDAPHLVLGNQIIGGELFIGNAGSIYPLDSSNIDSVMGAPTDQSFVLLLRNNAGTLQQAFWSDINEQAIGRVSKITGATTIWTNTPTGTDSSTAFAGGAKISTTTANAIILATANQDTANNNMIAGIAYNTTGTAYTACAAIESIDVNGVTQNYLTFQLFNASTGAAVAINTTSVPSGTSIAFSFYGKIA